MMKKKNAAVLVIAAVTTTLMAAETRTLQKNIGKDIDGQYPKTWDEMSGVGYWAAAGSENDKLEAGYDYVIPSGKLFCTPQAAASAGTLAFPGNSLTIVSGATLIFRHNGSTVDFGTGGLVVCSSKGILNYCGSKGRSDRGSAQAYVRGPVTIESPGVVTLGHGDNVNVGETFYDAVSLSADATLDCVGVTGWDATNRDKTLDSRGKRNSVELLGDTSKVLGDILVQTNMYFVVGESGLGNAKSVTLFGNRNQRAYSASLRLDAASSVRSIAVNNLTLHDAAIEIPVVDGVSTYVQATGSLTVDGFVDIYISKTAMDSNERTHYPVLVSTSKIEVSDFNFAGVYDNDDADDTSFDQATRLIVLDDPEEGTWTLYVEVDPTVKCVLNATSGNTASANYYCQLTNAAAWADGELPREGYSYVCFEKYLRGPLYDADGVPSGAYRFPGLSLTLGAGTEFYETYSDFFCSDLRMMAGSRLMLWNNAQRRIGGNITVCPDDADGVARVTVYQNRKESIYANINGKGVLYLGGNSGSGTPLGTVTFAGDNSAFKGKMKFATGQRSESPALPSWSQQFVVYVSSDSHLGGPLAQFIPDAFWIGDYTLLHVTDDMDIAENRGMTVDVGAEISVSKEKTASFGPGLHLDGELVKSGGGTLALGGAFSAGAKGNFFKIREGAFKPLTSGCVDGAAIEFVSGTRIVYDLTIGVDLVNAGIRQVNAGSSMECQDGQIDVEIIGSDDEIPNRGKVSLLTASKAQCDSFVTMVRTVRSTVGTKRPTLAVVENADETYTVQADVARRGLCLIFR